MTTDQEEHWKHNDAYHARSPGDEEANYYFFRKALASADLHYDCSIVELGCGTGANLRALSRCYSLPYLAGVELNSDAISKLPEYVHAIHGSILDWRPEPQYDLAFTKGVLIHIAPENLPAAYSALVNASRRYVLVAEYFCPMPRMIPYRGQIDRLWASDFAGEIMDAHGLKLVDYGFVWKRDQHPQDDITWFLMEKP